MVAPSTNSTMEWTTDCGCTTTAMSAGATSNRRCASMSSSPLLTRVEELTVTTGPIVQVGCARACSAVTAARSARARPRKGPPEAVSTRRRTSLRPVTTGLVSPFSWRPEARAWAMAECSESTGTTCPSRRTACRTRAPPTTRDSLFARARRAPVASAARVGRRPTEPVMPFRTVSSSASPAPTTSSTGASGPTRTSATGSGRPRRSATAASAARARSRAPVSEEETATRGTSWTTACSASSSRREPPAASPTTRGALPREPRRATTSRAWVPIEPVDPSTTSRAGA